MSQAVCCLVAFCMILPGCAVGRQGLTLPAAARLGEAGAAPSLPEVVQQQGGANLAADTQIEARGLSIETAAPLGLTVVLTLLLGWIVWLSHRRELVRLGREKGNEEGNWRTRQRGLNPEP